MQRARCASQVEPPSAELVSAMKGDGHCLSHPGGATPYRVVSRYAYGAPGSVATAGSQSSVDELRIREPTQPLAGRVVFATGPPNLPLALAWLSASRRSAVSASLSSASWLPPRPIAAPRVWPLVRETAAPVPTASTAMRPAMKSRRADIARTRSY